MKKTFISLAIAAMTCAGAAVAGGHASGDAAAGETVFKKCKSCHMIQSEDGSVNLKGGKVGPNLYGVASRTAGSVEGFRYGKSIIALGETGLAWDEAEFVAYVADPSKYLQEKLGDKKARSKMTYKLRGEQDAKDVYAYLVSLAE